MKEREKDKIQKRTNHIRIDGIKLGKYRRRTQHMKIIFKEEKKTEIPKPKYNATTLKTQSEPSNPDSPQSLSRKAKVV